jgi:hypothetical protein
MRSGVLEFLPTHIVIDGEAVSYTDFFCGLIDAYYRHDLSHEHGSAGWFHELTGIDLSVGCPLCHGPDRITACPQCSIGRCAACVAKHDGSSLCQLTREAADIHRQMRGDDDFDPSDFYFARRAMASSFLQRSRQ